MPDFDHKPVDDLQKHSCEYVNIHRRSSNILWVSLNHCTPAIQEEEES